VQLKTICSDLIGTQDNRWDVVLAADLWYERFLALRMTTWLKELSQSGVKVFLGDLGRAFLPREELHELAQFNVPDLNKQEQRGMSLVRVYEFDSIGK
jgi:predicted nicotinamide N-methyase